MLIIINIIITRNFGTAESTHIDSTWVKLNQFKVCDSLHVIHRLMSVVVTVNTQIDQRVGNCPPLFYECTRTYMDVVID
jgi:hypothetical protein